MGGTEGERDPELLPGMLQCDACGRLTDGHERGWHAVHGVDGRDQLVLVVYCSECARDELDPER